MRLEHVLPEGQHGSAEKATAPTRPPHWPHAPVAHAAEIWSASVLLPSVVTAPPLCKLMRSNAVNPTAPSAIATTDFSLPELRSHAQRLVAPESRPLSLESSYPSIAREAGTTCWVRTYVGRLRGGQGGNTSGQTSVHEQGSFKGPTGFKQIFTRV